MKVDRSKSTGPGADSSAGKLGGTASSATASPDAVKPVAAAANPTPLTKPASESQQDQQGTSSSAENASEMQLKALVQDLHDVFKELGIVPPPSRFGGIQLALAAEENAADQSAKNVNNNSQLDLMRLMIVKNMAKTMAQRLAEKQHLADGKTDKEKPPSSEEQK